MVFSSFKTTEEIFRYTYPFTWKTLFPPNPTFENYVSVFMRWRFGRKLLNSIFVASAQVIGTLATCSLAAYVFGRMRFPGRDALFGLVLLGAMIPFEVIMIPLYLVVRSIDLQNTYWALFLPWLAYPFGIFLLRQAFMEIPRDYDEAAIVEGANHFQIFWHVILPNTRSALVTVSLMTFLFSWNQFLWPLIVMQDQNKQLVQVALASFTVPSELPAWGEIFAAATVTTLPVLILFLVLQRYYIEGVVMSGIKG
jgi:multiple sugar transport system permease protein/putative chitobiose transport system permease protein